MIRKNPPAARIMTVDEVVRRVKKIIDLDVTLSRVNVSGELTSFKHHESGHVYFTLKGAQTSVSCVMFSSYADGTLLWPEVGDSVIVSGSVKLYEARGTLQIYAVKIMPVGEGAAARAKALLKAKLEAEGLFSPSHKRPIPKYPRRVVCVTSESGAAIQDVIKQYRSRRPLCELLLSPCLVQGISAPESAVRALRLACSQGADVVMLVRGGGSKEDLAPFDDEELVREVARCPVPIVTGIGHEIDFSLCDMAADRAEPTPTAAAVAVFCEREREKERLGAFSERMADCAGDSLRDEELRLSDISESLFEYADETVKSFGQRLDETSAKLSRLAAARMASEGARLKSADRALKNLSPHELARRGFCMVTQNGSPLVSAGGVKIDDELEIHLLDGLITARAEDVRADT